MKNLIVLFSFYGGSLFPQINFERSNWEEIKLTALKANKLIFVDAYTKWCGPCKWMEKNVFTDGKVGMDYNAKFVNAKFDMDEGEGPMLGKLYDIGCYPTFLFIDGNGKVVHRVTGQLSKSEFRQEAVTAETPSLSFSGKQQRYDAGERNVAFVNEYIHALIYNCMSASKVAASYLTELRREELLTPENWGIFAESIHDPASEPFVYFLANRPVFVKAFGDSVVNSKIFDVYLDIAKPLIYRDAGPDEVALAELGKAISGLDFPRREELSLMIDNAKAEANRDWVRYFETAKILIDKFRGWDFYFLNSASYEIYLHSNNKAHLEVAEVWAKRSVDIYEVPENLDTYACLLNRNGKKDQAIATQKRAIRKAKQQGGDSGDLEKTLKEIQSGKG
jgi:thiol-disulfide isomerase/thioredoxin